MFKKTSILALMILAFLCGCSAMRNSGTSDSPYIGEVFETKFGMAYIENLPKGEDAPEHVLIGSDVVWVTDRRLDNINSSCTNCLSADRLITPIRVTYVPKGTQFKAIESYRIKHGGVYAFFNHDFDILLIEDGGGHRAEVNESFFEYKKWKKKPWWGNDYDIILPTIEKNIKENGYYDYNCQYHKPIASRTGEFITDFRLNKEMSILKPVLSERSIVIRFTTITAYLTFAHFSGDWLAFCDKI